eukprot:TRINITY_DN8846_c0_g2_i10.p1 TRINITY_DN8846_c0_g2~~TRINITY_DN8846_c0_g2_i10.p1  ORF type:complete len:603 (+),score=91.99 TRINITY_DN8846_c0_g2_i10:474-2282(+)
MSMDIDDGILDLSKEDDDFMQINSSNSNILINQQLPEPAPQAQPPKIRVVVRKRPIFRKEADRGETDIADVDMSTATCVIHEPKVRVDLTKYTQEHNFNFDDCLDENVDNEQIYRITVKPLVDTLFNHGKSTVFAYGQTGSGKTYTMMPLPVRAAQDILDITSRSGKKVLVVSCFEIYGQKLFDLLNRRRELKMLEDGKGRVNVKGLKELPIQQIETLQDILVTSQAVRSTGSTGANQDSSRSHSIMQFCLREILGDGSKVKQVGKLSFIDLAGSERGADTFNNDSQTRMEGAEINKSLLALKECIRGLDSGQRHVPFRGSKLTQVLSDSFVGDNSRTVMIATISPNSKSCEHTLNTLRYADRVKELRNDQNDRGVNKVTPTKILAQNKDAYGNTINKASPDKKQGQEKPQGQVQSTGQVQGQVVDIQENVPEVSQVPQIPQTSRTQPQSKPQPSQPVKQAGPRTRLQQQQMLQQQQQQQQQNQNIAIENDLDEDVNMEIVEDGSDCQLSPFDNLVLHHRQYVEGCMDMVRNELDLITQIDKEDISMVEYVHLQERMLKRKQDMVGRFEKYIQEFKQNCGKQFTNNGGCQGGGGLRSGRRKK